MKNGVQYLVIKTITDLPAGSVVTRIRSGRNGLSVVRKYSDDGPDYRVLDTLLVKKLAEPYCVSQIEHIIYDDALRSKESEVYREALFRGFQWDGQAVPPNTNRGLRDRIGIYEDFMRTAPTKQEIEAVYREFKVTSADSGHFRMTLHLLAIRAKERAAKDHHDRITSYLSR